MVVLGVIFWIGWYRTQFVREHEHFERAKQRALDHERIEKSVERY